MLLCLTTYQGEPVEDYRDGAGIPDGEPRLEPGGAGSEIEVEALLLARSELSVALRNERDPARRRDLLTRLVENRAEILRAQRQLGLDSPQSAALRTSRSQLVDPWVGDGSEQTPVAPSQQGPGPGPGSATNGPVSRQGIGSPGAIGDQRQPRYEDYGNQVQPVSAPMARAAEPKPNNGRTLIAFALISVLAIAVGALAYLEFTGRSNDTAATEAEVAIDSAAGSETGDAQPTDDRIAAVLNGMGLGNIVAEDHGTSIHLSGQVATAADRDAAVGAVQALAGDKTVDASQIIVSGDGAPGTTTVGDVSREAALQSEFNRLLAVTPIIFDLGQSDLTELQLRILNQVPVILEGYPGAVIKIVGFADGSGDPEVNRVVSLARSQKVKDYLVSQGVSAEGLQIDARGEDGSSGSAQIAQLERRVEFEVLSVPGGAGAAGETFRIAIVAPSDRADLAFTQSMVEAVNIISAERGNVEVAITDNTFVPEDAGAAIRDYAGQDFDLVIAHGSQFGALVAEIAPDFPEVAFAWGTASDTFGLPNVYAYDAASEQGGYVLGAISGLMSESGVVGIVGPIEVGDAKRYVDGFKAGAEAESAAAVLVSYTGSFSDVALAAQVANEHVAAGADIMTGSAQMVVGAVSVAQENGVKWFGTQANQTSLAPDLVVASQVYHWEVILSLILADVDANVTAGRSYAADLANGGLVIEYNPGVAVDEGVRQRADQVVAGIANGSITVPAG